MLNKIAPNLCSGEHVSKEAQLDRLYGMAILAFFEMFFFLVYLAVAYSEGVWTWRPKSST